MAKQFIFGFIAGAITFGAVGALAAGVIAEPNRFPIKLNGNDVEINGYNINGSTYFRLRDISNTVGGFDVDFRSDTILLSKDGYEYGSSEYIDYTKYVGTYCSLGGTLGFNWILGIENISGNSLVFTYTYEKPGSDVIADIAQFVDPTTAVAKILDEVYRFELKEDRIIMQINDGVNAPVTRTFLMDN